MVQKPEKNTVEKKKQETNISDQTVKTHHFLGHNIILDDNAQKQLL